MKLIDRLLKRSTQQPLKEIRGEVAARLVEVDRMRNELDEMVKAALRINGDKRRAENGQ